MMMPIERKFNAFFLSFSSFICNAMYYILLYGLKFVQKKKQKTKNKSLEYCI